MSDFPNGITSYVHAQATVDVFFPIDERGVEHVSCRHCYFYRDSSHRCGLNYEVCASPEKYVGASCPLRMATDNSTGEIVE